ncbi:MAG TPA: SH3 domain-containing protein [Acetobacteraceae bacterium]|nr:SH3 domain-containing protein [Acetobacteraceae bacterium]
MPHRHCIPRHIGIVLTLLCLAFAGSVHAAAIHPRPAAVLRGSQTHLLLPRFASIRAPVANLRRGPGLRYPIAWVYRRRHLPVLILREFGNWRLLRLPDGTRGWMSRLLLTPHRSFVVIAPYAILRGAPRPKAAALARLRRGVVGVLRGCKASTLWCRVSTHGYSGFVRRTQIWGSDSDARINAPSAPAAPRRAARDG